MRNLSCILLAAMSLGAVQGIGSGTPFGFVSPAMAQTLPTVWQNKAKKLTQAIAKQRQSLGSDAAAILTNDFKRNQFEDRLASFRQNLARIPAADDPLRNAAVAELALLEAELEAAKGGGGVAAAPEPAPSQVGAEPAAPETPARQSTSGPELIASEENKILRVMKQINETRDGIRRLGLNSRGDSIVQSVKTARQNLKRFDKYDHPTAIAARDAFAALEQDVLDLQTLARTEEQLGKAAENIAGLRGPLEDSVKNGKPSALQDPNVRKQVRDKIAAYADALEPYRERTTPNAVAALKELNGLKAAAAREEQRADEQLAKLGDLPARIGTLFAKMKTERDTLPIPKPLVAPFTAERVAAWRAETAKVRAPADANLVELRGMQALAYDRAQIDSLATSEEKRIARIEDSAAPIKRYTEALQKKHDANLKPLNDEAQAWKSESMPTEGALVEAFRAADRQAATRHIEAAITSVQTVIDIEQSYDLGVQNRTALIGNLSKAKSAFDAALEAGVLPEAKSTDADMLAFAAEALADDEEIGEVGPVVLLSKSINSGEYTHARSKVSDVNVSASGDITGTVRTQGYTAVWKTFNYAVPIKTGDDWHLWKIEAYNYSSSNVYPTGRWIAQKKTQGKPLPRTAFK